MNVKLAAATFAAALFLTGAPAFASAAQAQAGPIRIDNVQIFNRDYVNENGGDTAVPNMAVVAFTNQYGLAATEVVFALETNGYVIDRFDDIGSFAPGVKISHKFAENQSPGNMRVAVEKATFADGTVWDNADVPQPLQPNPMIGIVADDEF